MAWIVGIDEAGYGPNLGPLVQSAVAVRVPDASVNLWQMLKSVVRKADDAADGRTAIDDSKAIHQGPAAFARLEDSVLSAFPCLARHGLSDWLASKCIDGAFDDLAAEPWYSANIKSPLEASQENIDFAAARLAEEAKSFGVEILPPRCAITPTPRFNEVVTSHGSKGATTGRGIIALIADCFQRADEEVTITIDKLGGRNYYAPMIQTAIPDGWVMIVRESSECSEYRIEGLKVPMRIIVRPRAESDQMTVALASMLSKYLRELFMKQFNAFWLGHVPNLIPTAGYPNDATRFYDAIRPACKRLGIAKETVWRSR